MIIDYICNVLMFYCLNVYDTNITLFGVNVKSLGRYFSLYRYKKITKLNYKTVNQVFIEKTNKIKSVKKITFVGIADLLHISNNKMKSIRRGGASATPAMLQALDNAYPELFKENIPEDDNSVSLYTELKNQVVTLSHNVTNLIESNKKMSKELEELKQLKEEYQTLKEQLEKARAKKIKEKIAGVD